MALTKCNVPKDVIGSLGTNPSERGLTTQQFKDKFDEMPEGIIDYINETLTEELDTVIDRVAAISNRNILMNWDFSKPVNQIGSTTYSGGYGFCLDRWFRHPDTTVEIKSGYITISAASTDNAYFFQRLEALPAGTYTLSVKADGETKYATLAWDGTLWVAGDVTFGAKVMTLGLMINNGSPTFYMLPRTVTTYDIYAVKLERGNTSTLSLDPPADYGEQLSLCQRYMLRLDENAMFRAVNIGGTTADYFIPTPVTMRTTPNIDGVTFAVQLTTSTTDLDGVTFSVPTLLSNGFIVRATRAMGPGDSKLVVKTGGVITAHL